mgnify:CR=1 FL=1
MLFLSALLIVLIIIIVGPSIWIVWSSYQKWENLTWVNRSVRVIAVVGIPWVLVPVLVALMSFVSLKGALSQETVDPNNYTGSVQSWLFPSQVDHFPDKVPRGSDPSFYYMPKVMQGWGHIYLEVKQSHGEIKVLLREAKQRSVYVSTWTDEGSRVVRKNTGQYDSENYPSPDFFGKEADLLPRENYVAYYYGAKNTSNMDRWNHGYIYGVAFHKHKRRISYWAKRW